MHVYPPVFGIRHIIKKSPCYIIVQKVTISLRTYYQKRCWQISCFYLQFYFIWRIRIRQVRFADLNPWYPLCLDFFFQDGSMYKEYAFFAVLLLFVMGGYYNFTIQKMCLLILNWLFKNNYWTRLSNMYI